jgi:flagellar assembly protein FliH
MTQNAPAPSPPKFLFDTVFDNGAVVPASRAKRHFTAEDLEQARAEGRAEGERSAVALAEAAMAAALDDIGGSLRQAMGALVGLVHEHRRASAELALACARRIADAALDSFPQAPAEAALAALSMELASEPRLLVRAPVEDAERLAELLTSAAERIGLTCQIVVRSDPAMPRAAFGFDWGDGKAQFDPVTADAAVAEALATALAAEGLHGEPIVLEQVS